jgi:hypothetical protein
MRCYNAAMDAEPPKADPPKRKRRWFQFSVRTLLIGVTVLSMCCAYFGGSAKVAWERSAMLKRINRVDYGAVVRYGHKEDGPNPPLENKSGSIVSWEHRLFGDEAIAAIFLPLDTEKKHLSEIHAMFPEAKIGAFTAASPESLHRFIKWFDFADEANR